MKTKEQTDIVKYKINNFDNLPDHKQIPQNIIVWVHLNLSTNIDQNQQEKLNELDSIVKKNTKSRLMVHVDVSHMIHYKIPNVIINSINSMIK